MILKIDDAKKADCNKTDFDTTPKGANPLGGWVHYGLLKNEFVIVMGITCGVKKQTVLLREALLPKRNVNPLKL